MYTRSKKLELGVESVASHARVRDGQPVGPGRLGAEVEATLCATRFTARPRGRSQLRDERDVVSNVIERLGAERVRGHVEHLHVRCGVEAWWWHSGQGQRVVGVVVADFTFRTSMWWCPGLLMISS